MHESTPACANVKNVHSLIKSFGYAISGIVIFFRTERNGMLHLLAATAVVAAGLMVHLTGFEWIAILLCIALVISLEMLNTALEKLCDEFCPHYNPAIKLIKDISAGAVLCAAVISVIVGLIIFIPAIIR